MAHDYQYEFVEYVKNNNEDFFSDKKVLEVGSLNINGTVRDLFNDCDYIGIDVGEGIGVDVVCSGHEYDASDDTFDVTLSTECFEHNPYWAETFANMVRLTKSGGLVFFTCATTGRPVHGTANTNPHLSPLLQGEWANYYKNITEHDVRKAIDVENIFSQHEFIVSNEARMDDLYFYGIKK